MTLALDPPLKSGRWTVAALCDTGLWGHATAGGLAVVAHKAPVAILLSDGEAVHARDLAGHPLDLDALETKCPGLILSLREAAFGA